LRRLKKLHDQGDSRVKPWSDALEVKRPLAEKLFTSTVRTYYMGYQPDNTVVAKDISELRTNSADPAEAAWGLMQEDAIRMADIVSQMNLNFGD
jgi:hypothetical protein